MEQSQGSREGVGGTKCCVLPEIHLWWQPCEQGHCHGAGSNCRNATSQGDCYSNILCNLSDSQASVSANDFSHTSPRCGRWTTCLGGGRLQRIGIHFWNGNTTQMPSIDLGRTLRKLLAAFRTFQHQFSPGGIRNWCTRAAELSPPSWDATHTAGRRSLRGFHRANAGRCLVATSLRIIASPKKISPACVCVCWWRAKSLLLPECALYSHYSKLLVLLIKSSQLTVKYLWAKGIELQSPWWTIFLGGWQGFTDQYMWGMFHYDCSL
jgi:hypothetical protein